VVRNRARRGRSAVLPAPCPRAKGYRRAGLGCRPVRGGFGAVDGRPAATPGSRPCGGAARVSPGLGDCLCILVGESAAQPYHGGAARRSDCPRARAGCRGQPHHGATPADALVARGVCAGGRDGGCRARHPRCPRCGFHRPRVSGCPAEPCLGYLRNPAAADNRSTASRRPGGLPPLIRCRDSGDDLCARRDGGESGADSRPADRRAVLPGARPRRICRRDRVGSGHHQRTAYLCAARAHLRVCRDRRRHQALGWTSAADLVVRRRSDRRTTSRRLGSRLGAGDPRRQGSDTPGPELDAAAPPQCGVAALGAAASSSGWSWGSRALCRLR